MKKTETFTFRKVNVLDIDTFEIIEDKKTFDLETGKRVGFVRTVIFQDYTGDETIVSKIVIQEEGEMKMAEVVEEVVEEVEEMGKYIPEIELTESQKLMRGRTLYTINKNMEIVKTVTVRCNPSSYDRDALKLFLDNNSELLKEYHNSENNYGIGFCACGYDGRAQQEFAQSWADNGVRVF